jgi:hypothetical protein
MSESDNDPWTLVPKRTTKEKAENRVISYQVRQVNAHAEVLSQTQVLAPSYGAVLRKLADVSEQAHRIEVYDQDGERAGAITADYWRHWVHRRA